MELAVRLADASGGSATVLTLGPTEASEQLRTALSLGCSSAVHIRADMNRFGPADVATEIAAVVRDHEITRPYDLVLAGSDAADSGDFQVGIRLGRALERPIISNAKTVTFDDGRVTARVSGPDGLETWCAPLPAVITVVEGGVEPRYPSIRGRMSAKKIPIEERTPLREPAGPNRLRLRVPPSEPNTVKILGEGPKSAPAVVDLLDALGVLP